MDGKNVKEGLEGILKGDFKGDSILPLSCKKEIMFLNRRSLGKAYIHKNCSSILEQNLITFLYRDTSSCI